MEIIQAITVYRCTCSRDKKVARTNPLILTDWFFNRSSKELSDPLLLANIVLLMEFLPEPVGMGHARYRVGNLQVMIISLVD